MIPDSIEKLRARADARLNRAHNVLEELQILEHWRKHAEPILTGSVALGLVVRPDIDMAIHMDGAPRPEAGFAVVSAVASSPHVRKVVYNNELDLPMKALYWKIVYETPADRWTIDMWLYNKDNPASAASRVGPLRDAMTEEARDIILAIKEEADSIGDRAHGHWLYRAVLAHGIRSYNEYVDWIGDQDVWEQSDWVPAKNVGSAETAAT